MPLAKQLNDKIGKEEYLQGELSSEVKHELIDGKIYAMTGASDNHNKISGNIFSEIKAALRTAQSPCSTYISDMKVNVANQFFYPDVMVVCDKSDNESNYYKKSPTLIIEVLSKSTKKTDRTLKRLAYQNIPSLEEYVLIEQINCEIEVFRKRNAWQPDYYYLGDRVPLESVGLTISVEDIYYQVNNEDVLEYLEKQNNRAK